MTTIHRCFGGASLAAIFALALPAHADDGPAADLSAVERAYQAVNYATTKQLAERTLHQGGASRDATLRLKVLHGLALAALGEDEAARRAYLTALAIDPEWRLDRTVSPKLRAPYLEALGYWAGERERLGLTAAVDSSGPRLTVQVMDPAHLVDRVELRLRSGTTQSTVSSRLGGSTDVAFRLPPMALERGVTYRVVGLDADGNTLVELGTEAAPRRIEGRGARGGATEPGPRSPERARSYLLPVTLALGGAALAGAGAYFHVKREQLAHEWNGPGCENPGKTRLEQCSAVDRKIREDGRFAIAGYSAAAVLLGASAVTLLTGSAPEHERVGRRQGYAACGVGIATVVCRGEF